MFKLFKACLRRKNKDKELINELLQDLDYDELSQSLNHPARFFSPASLWRDIETHRRNEERARAHLLDLADQIINHPANVKTEVRNV